MAEAVGTSQKTDWFRDLGPITVAARSERAIEFAVVGRIGGRKVISFTVTTGTDGGSTTVRTRLSHFQTSQNMIMGFIPAGPKLMLNYATYRLFLERLSTTMREADPAAAIVISDTADTDPIPGAYSPAAGGA